MDEIKHIRRMYEIEGVSIREIMRRTGIAMLPIVRFSMEKMQNAYCKASKIL
ncbi:MAG: hypothetical protein U9Q80_00725 [Bacillota bacterium]|nr:hypothetical protein [Bacillota bacterium]